MNKKNQRTAQELGRIAFELLALGRQTDLTIDDLDAKARKRTRRMAMGAVRKSRLPTSKLSTDDAKQAAIDRQKYGKLGAASEVRVIFRKGK